MRVNANSYALALYDISLENKKLSLFKEYSLTYIDVLDNNEDLLKFFDSKIIAFEIKEKIIRKTFVGPDAIVNCLLILAKKNIFSYAKTILQKLVKLINQKLGVNEGIIYTNYKLSPLEINKIEKNISSRFQIPISLKNKIDETILLGFKIEVNNQIIEDTSTSRLEDLKNELLTQEGTNYGK